MAAYTQVQSNMEVVPPCTNRGAVNTSQSGAVVLPRHGESLHVSFDWVEFTFPGVLPFEEVFDLLGLDKSLFTLLDRGLYFYRERWQFGSITVLTSGLYEDMGHHVILRGKGCREYEGHVPGLDWAAMCALWLELGVHFTRVDVAIDDRPGGSRPLIFRPDMVRDCLVQNRAVMKLRTWHEHVSGRVSKKIFSKVGRTVTVGGSQSLVRVRFYDKAVEQQLEEDWTRTEIQVRDGRADALMTHVSGGESLGSVAFSVLKHYIRFCDVSDDSNRSRWKVCKWWSAFLGAVEALHLRYLPEKVSTIEKRVEWIRRQVGKSLALGMEFFEGDLSWLFGIISEGRTRLREVDRALIGTKVLDIKDISPVESCSLNC